MVEDQPLPSAGSISVKFILLRRISFGSELPEELGRSDFLTGISVGATRKLFLNIIGDRITLHQFIGRNNLLNFAGIFLNPDLMHLPFSGLIKPWSWDGSQGGVSGQKKTAKRRFGKYKILIFA